MKVYLQLGLRYRYFVRHVRNTREETGVVKPDGIVECGGDNGRRAGRVDAEGGEDEAKEDHER